MSEDGEKEKAAALAGFVLSQPAAERQTRKLLEGFLQTAPSAAADLPSALGLAFGLQARCNQRDQSHSICRASEYDGAMNILAIVSGEYGLRHVDNLRTHCPPGWNIETWKAPAAFPLIIDYPEDFLPASFPPADLILSFAEHKAAAELLPDIAQMTGARGVVVAVDNEAWLPRGLARQLHGWLERMNVALAAPKPLCSLTETDYKITRRERESYKSEVIAEFARHFGQPDIRLTVDETTGTIASAEVQRDAVCGCARFVAEKLVGLGVAEVNEKAGLAHHHFPCLASMVKLNDYNHDTLMHESGHLLQENLEEQLKPFRQTRYIAPGTLSE